MSGATREEAQQRLQSLLGIARGALDRARAIAEESDLWFEFTGLRRGPGRDLKTIDVNDADEVALVIEDVKEWGGNMPPTQTDVLDLAEEWVGSWC